MNKHGGDSKVRTTKGRGFKDEITREQQMMTGVILLILGRSG